MSQMVLYANNATVRILITCPHCKFGIRHDASTVEDAIREGKPIFCDACDKPFRIIVVSQTRVAELGEVANGSIGSLRVKESSK